MAFYTFQDIAIDGLAAAVPKGIYAAEEQTASDLGYVAARALLDFKKITAESLGAVIFVSKTPDYRSPATATVLHNRLGLSTDCIAYDINLGGAGFIYGLQAGASVAGAINKPYVLLVIGDTVSKQLDGRFINDFDLRDGAAAFLIGQKKDAQPVFISLMADGNGYSSFMVPGGGFRQGLSKDYLIIDLEAIEKYFSDTIPVSVLSFMEKIKKRFVDYDHMVFGMVNRRLTEKILYKLNIANDIVPVSTYRYGYTEGSYIPILLCELLHQTENIKARILTVASGEGYSWGLADFFVNSSDVLPVIETDEIYDKGIVSHDF